MKLDFDWDKEKAKSNVKKHKISFNEAKTIFGDPFLQTFVDDHSDKETRFVNLGRSTSNKILVLTHTERDGKVRIISCRKATVAEKELYEEGS